MEVTGGHTLVTYSDMPLCFMLPVSWHSISNPSEQSQAFCTVRRGKQASQAKSECSAEALNPQVPRQHFESHPIDVTLLSLFIKEAPAVGSLT